MVSLGSIYAADMACASARVERRLATGPLRARWHDTGRGVGDREAGNISTPAGCGAESDTCSVEVLRCC